MKQMQTMGAFLCVEICPKPCPLPDPCAPLAPDALKPPVCPWRVARTVRIMKTSPDPSSVLWPFETSSTERRI